MEIKRTNPSLNIERPVETPDIKANIEATPGGFSDLKDSFEIGRQPSVFDSIASTATGLTLREARNGLLDRWVNDSEFRESMRRDPEGTVEKHGVVLDESSRAVLQNIDWSLSDAELADLAAGGDAG